MLNNCVIFCVVETSGGCCWWKINHEYAQILSEIPGDTKENAKQYLKIILLEFSEVHKTDTFSSQEFQSVHSAKSECLLTEAVKKNFCLKF